MHWQVMPPFRVKNCVTFSLFGRVLAFGSWRLNLKNISAIFAIYNIQKSLCRLNFKKICPTFFLEYIGNFCELKSSVDISTSILCKWENPTKICTTFFLRLVAVFLKRKVPLVFRTEHSMLGSIDNKNLSDLFFQHIVGF